jgi:hypothetical protein
MKKSKRSIFLPLNTWRINLEWESISLTNLIQIAFLNSCAFIKDVLYIGTDEVA